ncbi:hypothetical protein [Brevibacterium gallinarum]|uniref:hypothetical protein n=1 Tax=Brevibacterium gallinarum TaxID=2762220 RepID=UPI001CD86EA3|nr:hypothetical protein [Brevibacterium gallinarum]
MSVVRVRAGGVDRWGDRLPETTTRIDGCSIAPTQSDEDSEFRHSVTTGFSISVPAGTDVRHTDEFRLPAPYSDGVENWHVVGEIADWRNPFTGWSPGAIVTVKRRSG